MLRRSLRGLLIHEMLARPIHLFGHKLHLAPLLDVAIHLLHIKLRFLLEHLYWRLVLIVNYSR